MRISIFILFIFFAKLSFSQKGDTLIKYLDKNLAFTNKAGSIYPAVAFPQNDHWILKAFYPDNSVIVEVSYLDRKLGVSDGPFTINYTANAPAVRGTYHNNYRSGVWTSWYKSGQLKDSGALVNDVLVGIWVTYYENGTLNTRAHFGDPVGSSGLSPLVSEKNSLLDFPPSVAVKNGLWQSWNKDGSQKDSGNYVDDHKIGYWKAGYDNGKPESMGTFGKDESLQGDWIFYRENGSISTKEKYGANNKLVDLECFDENGAPTGSFCSIAKPPVLLGTPYDWKLFFDTHLMWSKESVRKSREAIITVRFFISRDGKLTNHTLLNSPSPMVSEDIEKVVKLMTDWSPAILHNRPFAYNFDYDVNFYP